MFDWIVVNVTNQILEIIAVGHQFATKSAFKECATTALLFVKSLCVRTEKIAKLPTHAALEIVVG